MSRLFPSILLFVISQNANAFDPFTIATVASTVANGISTANEISGGADAFGELYSEINSDAQISEDGQKIITEVREVEALAQEAGYSAEEIDGLGHQNPDELRSLEGSIRALTKAVRAGKRVLKLVTKLQDKANNAQIESAQIEKEKLAATYKLIRLQNESNLQDNKKELKSLIEKKKQIQGLKSELKEKGAKTFGKTGVLSYQRAERTIETAIEVANRLRSALMSMVLVAFMMRVIFYQFGFFGVPRYSDLLRDTLLCGLLLMVYPDLIRAILYYTEMLAGKIGATKLEAIQPKEIHLPELTGASTSTKLVLAWAFEWIRYGSFAIIEFFMTFGISFMVMLFPIIIFSSQMLNFAVAWPVFIGSFITMCLWPIFWNLVGLAANLSWNQEQKTFAEFLYTIFLSLIQLFSPIVGIKLMSGQNLSKAIGEGAKAFTKPIGQAVQKMVNGNQERKIGLDGMMSQNPSFGIAGRNSMPSAGRVIGSAQGYVSNQIKSRMSNSEDAKTQKQAITPSNMSSAKAFMLNTAQNPDGKIGHVSAFVRGLKAQPIKQNQTQKDERL